MGGTHVLGPRQALPTAILKECRAFFFFLFAIAQAQQSHCLFSTEYEAGELRICLSVSILTLQMIIILAHTSSMSSTAVKDHKMNLSRFDGTGFLEQFRVTVRRSRNVRHH